MDINGNRPVNPAGSQPEPRPSYQDEMNSFSGQNNTSRPSQPQDGGKKGGKVKKAFLWTFLVLLILGAAGAAAYYYWQNTQTQMNNLRADLAAKDGEIAGLKAKDKDAQAPVEPKLTATQQIELAASGHTCLIKGMGCDKIAYEITGHTASKPGSDGFATVKATSGDKTMTTNLYLKEPSGSGKWYVVYEGQAPAPQAVLTRYNFPDPARLGSPATL